MYQKILETLNVKPEEAVVIGDRPKLDIMLPKRLRMKAVLLDRAGKFSEKSIVEADAVVKDLNEAIEMIIGWLCH